ncbi:hypothetical protein C9374_010077 [Naegleria lovaniensis]|uniref:Uncharacterized protein n=1 Tax=Naegleria lovaniensis TaxID=51637 RepID=A0AA88GHP3_NAELO|nr:uncharacterized protein C9374_010077 [Naegleria lovaniensis]KAG2375073.1 hypothetical protein C9374_010077 [Naegleria lovaniensis]
MPSSCQSSPPPFQVRTESIQFTSKAPSGNLTLFGTLYIPFHSSSSSIPNHIKDHPSNNNINYNNNNINYNNNYNNNIEKLPAVVLVHGSGPQNRNESIHNYVFLNTEAKPEWKKPYCGYTLLNFNTFHELAMQLASQNGMIVLTYDKRTCCSVSNTACSKCRVDPVTHQFTRDSCFYACQTQHAPQLLDLNVLTLDDLVWDVVHALEYLALNRSKDLWIDTTRLSLLGHSEGVNVVLKAMNVFNMMMNDSTRPRSTKYGNEWNHQDEENHSSNTTTSCGKYESRLLNVPPRVSNVFLMNGVVFDYGQLLLDQYQRILNKWILIKQVCEKEDPSSPLILNANQAIPITNQTIKALQDFFPKFKAGQYPLNWVYSIGGAVSGYFLKSSYEFTSITREQLLSMKSHGSSRSNEEENDDQPPFIPFVCSLNSPTDLNIQPKEYAALLEVMAQRESSKTLVRVMENLTHFDTPSDLSSPEITQQVMEFIQNCLTFQPPLKERSNKKR